MSKADFPAIRMRIEAGRLIPAGPYEQERINSFRAGTVVMCRFTEERDRVLVRKWWTILGLVVKQCKTPWKTKEEASEAVKLALGIVNLTKTVKGDFLAYPKSLTELEDPELQEAVDNMTELLSRLTGVDVETLKKETAHIKPEPVETPDPDKDHPYVDIESEVLSPDASERDDAASPPAASSNEPEGSVPPPSGSSDSEFEPIPDKELPAIRKFARIAFGKANTNGMTQETLTKVMNRLINTDLSGVQSKSGKDSVNNIRKSAKAIVERDANYESVIDFYSEMLSCEPADLMPEDQT